MFLKKIELKNFRNLNKIDITPNGRINLIVGENASGKTNFCEALYYLSCGQILKGERQRELIGWNQPVTTVELSLDTGNRIKAYLNRDTREKITKLNNKKCPPGEIYDHFQVLLFTPDNLRVLKGSPRVRRKFFNRKISDLDRNYSNNLKSYESVVAKKNASLKKEKVDPSLLEVFNEKITEYGSIIISHRIKYIEAINGHLSDIYCKFSIEAKHLELLYTEDEYRGKNVGDVKELIYRRIRKKAQKERERGYCLVGPHRDDFHFLMNGKDVKKYGSQGEQKLSVIAQKLAHLEVHYDRFDDYPVLVMDDIMGELDSKRRKKLLNNLPPDIQIFLTYTELVEPLPSLEGNFYTLEHGTLNRIMVHDQVAKPDSTPNG